MRKFILLIAIFITSLSTFGQTADIKGVVKDTTNNIPIESAAVAVLNLGDSILQSYTRSDVNGNFKITGLKDGDYILLVTYPKYADYVDIFSVGDGEANNSEEVILTQAAKILDEIVIRQAAIMMKGDTTIYMADSFKVRQNASVEELLKELPGIQVDRDGKITAQGQQVQKVLVDGDEFFSDDPTVATKNLRADAVQKVQVYDRKSDQAAFTGIDDGQEEKTINLQLKDGAKQGYFGKASVGALDKYYNATGMVNAFRPKQKFSVFGITSTTDQNGLDGMDQQMMGMGGGGWGGRGGGGGGRGGGGVVMALGSGGGGGMNFGSSTGRGLPESIRAGAHFDTKWNENKNTFNSNYQFNNMGNRAAGSTFSENTLFDSVYYTKNASTSKSNQITHSADANINFELDTTSQIRVTVRGGTTVSDNNSEDSSESLDEKFNPVNKSERKNLNHSESQRFNTNIFYSKRFKTPGRTISINLTQSYNASNGDGILDNTSRFFDLNGNLITEEVTDQNKVNKNETQSWEGRISYTNPVGKNSYLELNYSLNYNGNLQKRLSYDKDLSGKYNQLVDSLSNDFRYIYNTNTVGANYRLNGKNYNFSAGSRLSHIAFDQRDLFDDTRRKYSYTNLFPQADFLYRFNSFSNLRFNYSGSTSQPTIDQLQPLKNNDDPLNMVVGNPDLKQSFSNRFSLNYNSFEMMKDQYMNAGINFSTTSNQINSSYVIDNMGRRVTQYINVNGNYSFGGNLSFSRAISRTFRGSLFPNFSVSKTSNFINEVKNMNKNISFTPTVSLSKRDVENYDFSISYSPTFTSSKSSISTAASNDYWTQNISFDGRFTFPAKIDLGTNISFEHRQKLDATDNQNQVFLWNIFAEKRFLSKEQLVLRFSIHDILDQNKGYTRQVLPNAIVENNYLTFQRYGLITLTYNFNTTGLSSSTNQRRGGGGFRMR